MALHDVKEEILAQAKKDAKVILDEAAEHGKETIAQADIEVATFAQESQKQTDETLERLERAQLAKARFEAKRMALEARKEEIDMVFENAAKELGSLPRKEKQQIIAALLKKASDEMEIGKVYANSDTAPICKSYPLSTKEMVGGVRIENKDNTISIDYTFETMLAQIRERHLSEISDILFANK